MFALAMPMTIGAMGLGFEVVNWYMSQRAMQNAADAAVLAAASNAGANYDAEARAVAAQYGFATGVAVHNNIPCPGGDDTGCYQVTISGSVPLFLSPVVGFMGSGKGQQALSATAIATRGTVQRDYCILALAGSGTVGISTNGAPATNLAGCSIKSNTSGSCTNNLGADYGDTVGSNNGCGVRENSGVAPSSDAYVGLASSIASNPCSSYPQETANKPLPATNLWSGAKSLSGNVIICGDLQLTGNVTIRAPTGAVLVIENGRLDTNGFTLQTVSGSALTVVFSGTNQGGYIHAPTGNGTLDIAAPTTGPWSGIALYQDPKLTSGVDLSAAGTGPTWKITGLGYFPHAGVTLSGAVSNSTYGESCFAIVVDNIVIESSGDILPKGSCPAAGLSMPSGTAPARGVLVG
jgi:hypothetical protein